MNHSKRQGQYAPKQNSIPQPIAIGASGSQQGKGNAVPKIGPSPATVKPVTASKVSEETIKRADEYVEGRLLPSTTSKMPLRAFRPPFLLRYRKMFKRR